MNEIEQGITKLESKVQLETLERYIPKKTWSEIKPIIDRLKAFQEAIKMIKEIIVTKLILISSSKYIRPKSLQWELKNHEI